MAIEEWTGTVVVVVVVAVVVQCVRWLLAYHSFLRFFSSLPGPGTEEFSWIYGNMHKMPQKTEEAIPYWLSLTKKYPKFFRLWSSPLTASIVLNHPDTIREILKTDGPKGFAFDLVKLWLGESFIMLSGPRWYRMRRLLTPAFHFNILKPYNTINNRCCDLLLKKVEKHCAEKRSMEMFGNISLCTFDVILQCAMSYTDDVQTKGESHPYVQAMGQLGDLFIERYRNPLLHWDFVYFLTGQGRQFRRVADYVHSVSEKVIAARKETLEREGAPKKRHLDFLDILLTAKDENGQGLTPSEIRNEVHTFILAGLDTTASAISWTLYSLCQHPDIQHRVQQEVDTVLQGRDNDDIQWDDLTNMEYLTAVVKESMRFHCPVTFIDRCLDKPLTIEGVTVPKGTYCTINFISLHHNPTVWEEPGVFNPDRFLPENSKDRDSFAFVPFSAGPRNCIGQHFAMNEIKVVVSKLVRRFTFSLDPHHKVEKKESTVMSTENGMKMFAEPRKPSN